MHAGYVYWSHEDGTGTSIARSSVSANMPLEIVVPATEEPGPFIVDDTDVYYGTSSALKKSPLAGGSPSTLAITNSAPWVLVQDETHVYWTDGQPKLRVPKAGGAVETIATSSGNSVIMRVAAGYLYFATATPNYALSRIPSDGSGAAQVVLSAPSQQRFWGTNSQAVYQIVGTSQGQLDIVGWNHDGSDVDTLVNDQVLLSIAVSEQYVFFVSTKKIGRVAVEGGPAVGFSTAKSANEIAAEGAVVAWIENWTDVWVAQ